MNSAQGVPPFDPARRRGPVQRGLARVGRTQAGYWFGTRVAARIDPMLLRLSGGRVALTGFLPVATLTSTGARSGVARQAAVVYFSDGDDVILIASSFGRDRHPAWYHNLVAHPEATLTRGPRQGRYRASEVTDPAEHRRLFALAEQVYGGFGDYRERTAAIGRRIPVLRLVHVAAD